MSTNINKSLPSGFELKVLSLHYLTDIHGLLNNNYIEDFDCDIKIVFSKDFLYWYLKYIPPGFIIGLIYKKKLVGMICSQFIDMIIHDTKLKMPYINLLCIHNKLRQLGLASYLIDKMKKSILQMDIHSALFTQIEYDHDDSESVSKSVSVPKPKSDKINLFCETQLYAIPINYQKLKSVGILSSDHEELEFNNMDDPKLKLEAFHLTTMTDLESIVPKLNKFLQRFKVVQFFTTDSAKHFLLPKKNILYSFVKRTESNTVSDFIVMYVQKWVCKQNRDENKSDSDVNVNVNQVNIAYYYHETMSLTRMIRCIIPKLLHYGIDQLNLYTMGNNESINLTRYLTDVRLDYFLYDMTVPETNNNFILFYPF